MIKKLKIKNVNIKNNVFLAPMAGYTDVAFRAMCKSYGAGLTFTEMVSAKAICMGNKKTLELLYTTPKETPVAVQLFGNDPDAFAGAIQSGYLDKFDIIDINMGCPAPKIYSNGDGSSLMGNMPLARKIIETVVSVTDKPISVKFRSGLDEKHINAVSFAKMCEEAGTSMITVHPRTKIQGYSGRADYNIIREVTSCVSIPVIASGDVCSINELNYLVNECGASGVMIGRASLGKPEIFAELLKGIAQDYSMQDKLKQIKKHIKILQKYYQDNYISMTMKKHILNYVKEFKDATKLKLKVCEAKNLEEMIYVIKEASQSPLK